MLTWLNSWLLFFSILLSLNATWQKNNFQVFIYKFPVFKNSMSNLNVANYEVLNKQKWSQRQSDKLCMGHTTTHSANSSQLKFKVKSRHKRGIWKRIKSKNASLEDACKETHKQKINAAHKYKENWENCWWSTMACKCAKKQFCNLN